METAVAMEVKSVQGTVESVSEESSIAGAKVALATSDSELLTILLNLKGRELAKHVGSFVEVQGFIEEDEYGNPAIRISRYRFTKPN